MAAFEHGVVRIGADIVRQLADEIAEIRREPRLQLGVAASALDDALKIAQRILACGCGFGARGRDDETLDPRDLLAQAQSCGPRLGKEMICRREQFAVQSGLPGQFNSAGEQTPLRVALDGFFDRLPNAIDGVS